MTDSLPAFVRVLVRNAAPGFFDYALGQDPVQPGQMVRVPLGARQAIGVVWDTPDKSSVPAHKLRPVGAVIKGVTLTSDLRRLVDFVADYYLATPSAVLRMVLPFPDIEKCASAPDNAPARLYHLSGQHPARLTPARTQALARLQGISGRLTDLATQAGVSTAVLRGLVDAGALVAKNISPPVVRPDFAPPTLTPEQRQAADCLVDALNSASFAPILLEGVTGSGKTEIYFEAIANTLKQTGEQAGEKPGDRGGTTGGQTLVLVPEIALTDPWLRRFEKRFGGPPLVWHSGLSLAARRRAFHALSSGQAQVIVGARSALFLPYANLRLIIVDEAHDAGFKQEDGVAYHARDVAVMRAHFARIPVILASATPALETRVQAEKGRYRHVRVEARYGAARPPEISAIDMRRTPPRRGDWISPPLAQAIADGLHAEDQTLLFLNRRGYAPLTLCRACGARLECPSCTSWLVEHRSIRKMCCHHCGFSMPIPEKCPSCGEEAALVACGPGVERIADEVTRRWPEARTALATSDTIHSPAAAAALIAAVEDRQIDILIGTQLVAKGHHFPHLTLVGVIDADFGLSGGDFRAAEHTFQQIMQVAGRAGRSEKAGRALLQSHQPDSRILQALLSGDAAGFYATERAARQSHGLPPFARLAAIILSAPSPDQARCAAEELARHAPPSDKVRILGPAPAPLFRLRGRNRYRFLVQAPRNVALQGFLRAWLARVHFPPAVRIRVDIDPQSFV